MSSQRIETMQFCCRACGYGISVTGELPACPMCHRRHWQPLPIQRPLTSGPRP